MPFNTVNVYFKQIDRIRSQRHPEKKKEKCWNENCQIVGLIGQSYHGPDAIGLERMHDDPLSLTAEMPFQ